jgi:hypothetical protein
MDAPRARTKLIRRAPGAAGRRQRRSSMDLDTLQRIYTGKVVEVDGVHVIPVNAATGMALRQRFFSQYLQTDEDQYVAYWTVRRYVGKGTPPHDVSQKSEMIDFVMHTPGAIGYVDESDVQPGMNVILKR